MDADPDPDARPDSERRAGNELRSARPPAVLALLLGLAGGVSGGFGPWLFPRPVRRPVAVPLRWWAQPAIGVALYGPWLAIPIAHIAGASWGAAVVVCAAVWACLLLVLITLAIVVFRSAQAATWLSKPRP